MQPMAERMSHPVVDRTRLQRRGRIETLKYYWQAIVYRVSYVLLVPIVWLLDRLLGDRFWKQGRSQ